MQDSVLSNVRGFAEEIKFKIGYKMFYSNFRVLLKYTVIMIKVYNDIIFI